MILGLTEKILVLDVESSSPIDIKKQGQYIYWDDPETRVLMVGTKWLQPSAGWKNQEPMTDQARVVDTEQTKGWLPPALIEAIEAPKEEVMLAAANAPFDQAALRRMGYDTPDDKWIDVLVMAYILGFAGRLNDVLKQTPLGIEKNADGTRCITEFCVKRTPWYENPTMWSKFVGYCRDDADVEERLLRWCLQWLDTDWMAPSVRKIHSQDLIYRRINRRGIPVDRAAVRGALAIKGQETERLMDALRAVTGLNNPNSVSQLLEWCRAQGSQIENLQKATVRDEIATLPPSPLRSALELRADLGKTSVKKFDALDRVTGKGDRFRGGWQFYGASRTGRVAGRTLNPANLARPQISDPDTVVEWVAMGDAQYLRDLFPERPVLDTLSSCIRASLKAPEGQRWCVADLTSIESVGGAWMAGCDTILDIFFAGRDTYKTFAAASNGIPYDEVTKAQRTFAKPCLAADTLVLTLRGWVPIVCISPQDRLWDGEYWVSHGGLAAKGTREVLTRGGVTATPDHLFLDEGVWVKFKDLGDEFFGRDNASVCGASSSMSRIKTARTCVSVKGAEPGRPSTQAISRVALLKGAYRAPTRILVRGIQRLLRSAYRVMTGSGCQTGFTQCVRDATTRITGCSTTMAGAVLSVGSRVLRALSGSPRQYLDGITRDWRSTGPITTGTTNLGTYGSLTDVGTPVILASMRPSSIWGARTRLRSSTTSLRQDTVTPAPLGGRSRKGRPQSRSSPAKRNAVAPTFDVVNAGPRSRFTVKTHSGTAVAHNCVLGAGFGISGKGLLAYAEGYGIDMKLEEAERQVAVFREEYHEIVHHWRQLQDATVAAVLNQGQVFSVFAVKECIRSRVDERSGRVYRDYSYQDWPRIDYWCDGTFLFCRLPSGRFLSYYQPEVEIGRQINHPDGTPWFTTDSLSYVGIDQDAKGNAWRRIHTRGAKFFENNDQALCRDAMWHGLELIDADPDFDIVTETYDEIGTLVKKGYDELLDRLIKYMTTRAPWANERFFLGADGYVSKRYRK